MPQKGRSQVQGLLYNYVMLNVIHKKEYYEYYEDHEYHRIKQNYNLNC